MFQHKLIAPLGLVLCLSFIFACQKEQTGNVIEPQAITSDFVTSELADDAAFPVEDRDNCCRLTDIGTAGDANNFYAAFLIRAFSGTQYRFKIERLFNGQTYTTSYASQPGINLCYNNKALVNLTQIVAQQFSNCKDQYCVTCYVESNYCNLTVTTPWYKVGQLDCL